MNQFNPKVSIIIPVYNGSNYMRQAIDSALNQDYNNVEVIVINDGSNDNGLTDKIAKSYGDLITYYTKENGGVASALNYGISKMRGDYFSWLSHDDMYTKDKISKEIELIKTLNDKTEIVNCSFAVVDSNGAYLYSDDSIEKYTIAELEKPLFALFVGAINGCSLLIHKSHFERVGVFNENLPTTQDYDLWFRMLRKQPFHQLKGEYVLSRSHSEQDSKKKIESHIEECSDLWIHMISELSIEEIEITWGTTLNFYTSIRNFLRDNRGYKRALEYADYKLIQELQNSARDRNTKGNLSKLAIETHLSLGFIKNLLDFPIDTSKKRIAFILGDANAGGGLNRVNLVIASALAQKYDVYLISLETTQRKKGYEIDNNIKCLSVPGAYFNSENLAKILFLLSIDVYIESYNCLEEFLKLLKLTKIYNIKSIAWSHESYFIPYMDASLHNCLSIRLNALQEANAVIWLTNFSANIYSASNNNGIVIPNPVTIKNTSGKLGKGDNKNIIAIGRFDDDRKGLKELLLVFYRVLQSVPDAHLFIVGSYDLEKTIPEVGISYQQLIEKLKLPQANLHFEGWQNNVETYIKNARGHLMPSRYEGFGLVITECAAYAIPSIVFDGSGLEDIIAHERNGFICPQLDTDKMATYTETLLEDDILWRKMQKEVITIAESFSLTNIISKWENLIESLCSNSENLILPLDLYPKKKDSDILLKQCIPEYEKVIMEMRQVPTYSDSSQIEEELRRALAERDSLHEAYHQVTHSFSWKITKPLRFVRQFFH